MAAGYAWILNLDADVELAAIASATQGARAAYEPRRSVREAARRFVPGLAASLLDPGLDLLVDEDSTPQAAQGRVGRAFCPTPRALRLLRRAGAEPEPHPSCEVLVQVNARAFASSLGATLPDAAFVSDEARVLEHLGTAPPPEVSRAWRVKRNFGMAGRGQRVVEPSKLTEADRVFVRAGLAEGGVQIEPDVTIVDEFAIHGLLSPGGTLRLGPVVKQLCDARGAWLWSERIAAEKTPPELHREAERVAAALCAAGYFGPFGVDAYTYRVRPPRGQGAIALQPRSEINARFTMGFGETWRQLRG
jgi:hypothetical protein